MKVNLINPLEIFNLYKNENFLLLFRAEFCISIITLEDVNYENNINSNTNHKFK